jgi:hypothetical protein
MFHNRTQGGGNVVILLKMGKKVFMQRKSTFYQNLKTNGAILFTTDDLSKITIDQLRSPLSDSEIYQNKIVLNKIINNHSEKFKSLSRVLCCEK